MLREITIGQYYATDSLLHRLDPRVKIAGTLLYIISLFLVHHYIGLVVAALVFGVMVRMSNVPFRFIVKGLKPIMMMLVFTALQGDIFTGSASYHDRGCTKMYFFDGTFDPYDDRIFVNDADNDTESAHRRN